MEEKQFNVEFIQALKKKAVVMTDDYEVTETSIDSSDTNWINAFCKNYFTPIELIWELRRTKEKIKLLCQQWKKAKKGTGKDMEKYEEAIKDAELWMKACEGWEEEYVESKQINNLEEDDN